MYYWQMEKGLLMSS